MKVGSGSAWGPLFGFEPAAKGTIYLGKLFTLGNYLPWGWDQSWKGIPLCRNLWRDGPAVLPLLPGQYYIFVPERYFMYVTVSCWFLRSFVIQVYCTGHCSGRYRDELWGEGSAVRLFWAPNGTRLTASFHFTGPKKSIDFQDPTPSHIPS